MTNQEPTQPPQEPQQTTPPGGPAGQPVVTPHAPQGEQKSWMVALLLSILVGGLGIDRFYLGYIGLGVLKLITGGGCGVWYVIDIVLIATDKMVDAEGRPLEKN